MLLICLAVLLVIDWIRSSWGFYSGSTMLYLRLSINLWGFQSIVSQNCVLFQIVKAPRIDWFFTCVFGTSQAVWSWDQRVGVKKGLTCLSCRHRLSSKHLKLWTTEKNPFEKYWGYWHMVSRKWFVIAIVISAGCVLQETSAIHRHRATLASQQSNGQSSKKVLKGTRKT